MGFLQQRLTTATAGLRKASELFKLSYSLYSCNAPHEEVIMLIRPFYISAYCVF